MDGRDGAVLEVDGVWEIRFERRLKHAPEKVWDAITAPGQMSRWFDRTEFPAALKVGAVIHFFHDHVGIQSEGRITALDPPQLIEWEWNGPFGPASLMRWEIAPQDGGCRLTLRQQVPDLAVIARSLAGWQMCLNRLNAVVEGHGEPPGMDGWAALFELYKKDVLAAGITTPQAGAPEPATKP